MNIYGSMDDASNIIKQKILDLIQESKQGGLTELQKNAHEEAIFLFKQMIEPLESLKEEIDRRYPLSSKKQ